MGARTLAVWCLVLVACGADAESVNAVAVSNPCEGAPPYARCEVPEIPGGGACVDGECRCYADAQCADPTLPGDEFCSGGRCVATPDQPCDDGNPCTHDAMIDGGCLVEALPDGTQCSAFPVAVCDGGVCGQ